MVEVRTYDSWDEAMADINRSIRAADACARPEQISLREGDHFMSVSDGLVIFGRIIESYEDERLKFFRLVEAFSEACVSGEIGDAHCSQMRPISKDLFEAARAAGWQLPEKGGVAA